MKSISTLIALGLSALTLQAQQLEIPNGNDFSLFEILYPAVHVNFAVGDSSGDPSALAAGAHDPNRDGFTLQGIELDASLRLNDYIQGFIAHNFFWGGEEGEWGNEWEEYFGKLANLPGGFEIRGGRMLNRIGQRNARHLHAWSTVDQTLVNARFLGDEGLGMEGVEVTSYLPTPFTAALTVSYGDALSHDHDHGHGDEEEHGHDEDEEEHEDEEHGEEDHDEEEHGHDEEEESEAEELLYESEFYAANLLIQMNADDFNQFAFGGSFIHGDNGFEGETTVLGANFNYTWRENGLEAGGRQLSWTTEAFLRDFDGSAHAHEEEHGEEEGHDEEEHGDEDHDEEEGHDEDEEGFDDTEFGIYTELIYRANPLFDYGLRLDYVAGTDAVELPERFRASPLVTYSLSKNRSLLLRLQYNYDVIEKADNEHSVWAQVQYSFGGKEVR